MPTFNTPEPISAIVDIPAGHVRFLATDQADTTVEIRPADTSKGRDVKMAEQTKVEYGDGTLRIQAPAKNQYFGPSGYLQVTIGLPAGSRIEVKAASVDLQADGRFGDVTVDSEHGSIHVEETASARLTTAAGDISVDHLDGDAQIRTSKGDIRITEAVRGTVVLRTEAGEVEIGAATGVSASLDAGTSHGRIHNSLNNTEGAAAQLTIHATTTVGDIVARGR
ncbi:DUF4097 family beta strand repeat-containing protein [Amycolatopsis cynarae]|uniref:DUF4097 family beta strand repeat-containing protein n=1 Tax=Amycolatopsis cynarae TaxID=2995223 RepID=A0ABY7B9T1_9PSEU|nr:DUF4097 family beta strand repeat-containing protein [Amycolatopsis sp. HUAS 11-8]WAL69115.1 DUF4097 family beta strand repeat-containing protein [Amycolatopsis sp. HUAS 11-8]